MRSFALSSSHLFLCELPEGRNPGFEITVAPQYLPKTISCAKKKKKKAKNKTQWMVVIYNQNENSGNLPGVPVDKTSPAVQGCGFDPWSGASIPPASRPKTKT